MYSLFHSQFQTLNFFYKDCHATQAYATYAAHTTSPRKTNTF